MAWPEGYTLKRALRTTPQSKIHIAVRERDQCEVILKRYECDNENEGRSRREFDTLLRVAGPGVPRALEFVPGALPVIVIEYVPGMSLAEWRNRRACPPEPAQFLAVAIDLAEVLGRVHAAPVVHRDVTPYNVVVEPPSLRTHLIDFGLARPLGAAQLRNQTPSGGVAAPIGTLLYISPEQTGRMNRGVDARSDLYSLGATLYFMLTGRPPFSSDDPLALIHAHMARQPTPPSEIEPGVHDVLSRIVLKLLRKEATDRYQSARALRADLIECRARLERHVGIDADFELGAGDLPDRPRFAEKLHGRDSEITRLQKLFAESMTRTARVALIAGEPGSGKSALADQLRPAIAERGGYIAMGKFDCYRERPYAGWSAALQSLVEQLLVEADAHVAEWRRELGDALGNIGQALVDLVPDLGFILGEMPAVPALGPRESQARLSLALQRFMGVCATREHPLLLMLDDLQWSDPGSRSLLEELLSEGAPPGLLLIGAYRSCEVDADHPLTALLERVERNGVAIERFHLEPLTSSATLAILSEALERSTEDVGELARLVQRKTGGTPLLVQRFIEDIHERGLLHYRRSIGWTWDLAEVAAAHIPDGAVGLMTAKIARLEPEDQALLQFASCVGDDFDSERLCELRAADRSRVERSLYALADAGLIAPCPLGYRFAHDRIREAATQLLSDSERAQIHHDIARLLLKKTSEDEQKQRVFEIVEHLNRSLTHLSDDLRESAMRLNLMAGSRALAAGVAATAETYLSVARSLLRDGDWETSWELSFTLLLQSAETTFQTSRFDVALELLDHLERRARSQLEFVQVATKRLQVLGLTQETEPCARYALRVLRRLGVSWPLHPSRFRSWVEVRRVSWMLRGRDPESLFRPAPHVDPSWSALLIFLSASGGILSRVDARLRLLSSCLIMRRYLREGYVRAPAFVLSTYVTYAHWIIGAAAHPQQNAQLALEWNTRVHDPVSAPRTEMVVHALILPWLTRRRRALEPLDRIAEDSREVGDREYEYYARFLACTYRMLAGQRIDHAALSFRELVAAIERSGHWFPGPQAVYRAFHHLIEPPSTDAALERELQDCEKWCASDTTGGDAYVRTCLMLVLCVFGRHDLAFAQSEALGERLFKIVPYVHIADHTFYRGLAAGVLACDASGRERSRHRRSLRRSVRSLRRWAKLGPDFVHMVWMLEAQELRVQGHLRQARDLYGKAAERARDQEFLQHAAMAWEQRALILLAERRETEAATALGQAIALYDEWGAPLKARALAGERRKVTSG